MRLARTLLALVALLFGPRAAAGEQLPVSELVSRADAVGLVDVRLSPAGDTAEVASWIARDGAPVAPYAEWLKLCVPDRENLEKWLAGHPEHPGRAAWRRALDEGGYTSVVFFRERQGRLVPTCETEAMLARGWTTHPEHAAFRRELDAALAARSEEGGAPAETPPPPPTPPPTTTSPDGGPGRPSGPRAGALGVGCW